MYFPGTMWFCSIFSLLILQKSVFKTEQKNPAITSVTITRNFLEPEVEAFLTELASISVKKYLTFSLTNGCKTLSSAIALQYHPSLLGWKTLKYLPGQQAIAL